MKLAVLALVSFTAAAWQLRGGVPTPAEPSARPAIVRPPAAPIAYKAPPPPPVLALAPPTLVVNSEVATALDELFATSFEDTPGAARSISGHARSLDGEPLAGVTVIATSSTSSRSYTAITEENGAYVIADLPVLDGWVVTAYYADVTEEHPNMRTFADRTSVLDLVIDENVRPNWISGRVRDQDREVLAGATVIAEHPTLGTRSAITDEDGAYEITDLDQSDGWKLTVYYAGATETEWNTRWFSRHDSVDVTIDTSDRMPSSTPSCE